MTGSIKPEKFRIAKFFAISAIPLFLLGFVSTILLAGTFNFIPSTEWVAQTSLLRTIAGFLSAALLVLVIWKGGAGIGKLKRVVFIIASPFVGYFVGGNIVFIWPLLLPLLAGHEVALPFTVMGTTDGGKNCHSAAILEGMPALVGRVCNVPESVRLSLSPGSRVVVRGWGTRLGVYARDLSLTSLK